MDTIECRKIDICCFECSVTILYNGEHIKFNEGQFHTAYECRLECEKHCQLRIKEGKEFRYIET